MIATAHDVETFWFGPGDRDDVRLGDRQSGLWWGGNAEQDAEVRRRFAATLDAARAGELEHWAASPRSRLALIIVLDQFSRMIHRGTPEAFASDAAALRHTLAALQLGDDERLCRLERVFLYMPLEHAEDPQVQQTSVERFAALARTLPDGEQHGAYYLEFARRHRDIVERFGRFPHRNAILGRPSTPEELEFLTQPNSSF